MQLLKKILNKFNGLYYGQEYLCLDKEAFPDRLRVYIVSGKRCIKDVTNAHLFTGYSPLVLSFPSLHEINLSETETLRIVLSPQEFHQNDLIGAKDELAIIWLKRIYVKTIDEDVVYYYEGTRAEHRFISAFHQSILQWHNKLYNNRPGNVYLPGNLLKQVQVAYSLPRIISLITIKDADLFNLFPTDLHGQISDKHYIISLRKGGKAAQQVEKTRRILLSEIDPGFYKAAYELGKNHMQDLKAREQFPFSSQGSEMLDIPLPKPAISYRELELADSFDHGIHRFFCFKILSKRQIADKPAILAHIHNVYATWRHNKGLSGNYLLR